MHNAQLRGTIQWLEHTSAALKGNPLGDPHVRRFPVYLPPGYEGGGVRYPVIYALAGFTGTGSNMVNAAVWDENLPEQMDRLIDSGEAPAVIVVMPDCFTRLGGSQYVNSSATGPYRDYLTGEIIPFIDATLRTVSHADQRGVLGKSSGGYGALTLAMTVPGTFAAAASHSGDLYFEYAYLRDFPAAVNALNDAGGLDNFLQRFDAATDKGPLIPALNIIAMAACYSPDGAEIELPFELPSGRLREEVWQRWIASDPIRMIEDEAHATALNRLKLLWLDAGSHDEYALHLGARIFVKRLKALGIGHYYEEHGGGHRGANHRYRESLQAVARAIGAG
ncbi:MAG: esterase [Candidatus Marinimicrobia bacterium]|nr:esterase [Candidatus Neomarinimicrobiota bacterium]